LLAGKIQKRSEKEGGRDGILHESLHKGAAAHVLRADKLSDIDTEHECNYGPVS
jgi:hypothetical protein